MFFTMQDTVIADGLQWDFVALMPYVPSSSIENFGFVLSLCSSQFLSGSVGYLKYIFKALEIRAFK